MYDDPHHCTFEHFFSFPLTVTGSPRQLPMYRCQLPRAVEPTARPFTFKVLLCFKLLNKCPHRSSSSLLARSRLTRVSLPVVSIFRTRDDLSTSGISYSPSCGTFLYTGASISSRSHASPRMWYTNGRCQESFNGS